MTDQNNNAENGLYSCYLIDSQLINWQLFVRRDNDFSSATTMSTEIWYLLFNNEKKLLGAPSKAEVRDIADLKRATEEQYSELNVLALDLVVWRCKEPMLLSTQPRKVLQQCLSEIDFLEKEQVVELVSSAEIADLELGKKEVLLVGAPGAFSCSQVCPLSLSLISSL